MKKLFENVKNNQFRLVKEDFQLSRNEVTRAIKQLSMLAMNLSYDRNNPNMQKLTNWTNKEAKQLVDYLEKAEKKNDVDVYLTALAKRVVQIYDYVMDVLKQIKQDPNQIGYLKWVKPFVEKWRKLP